MSQHVRHHSLELTVTERKGARQPATAVHLLSLFNSVHSGNLGAIEIDLEVDLGLPFEGYVITSEKTSLMNGTAWNDSERSSLRYEKEGSE